jgi:hypothetical protein
MATDIEAPGSEEEELIAALSVLGGVKNVKGYGATGDGVTNDSAAIQAAVDDAASPYSSANRGIVFFPPGTYNVGSTAITYTGSSVKYIEFLGAPGAHISGAVVSDAILKRVVDSPYNGIVNVRNLRITNSHATGKGITIHSCIGAVVSGCHISAFIGVETYNSQAVTIEHCNIVRSGQTLASSVGIMAGNATSILNCDIVSYAHGIRHQNVGLTVIGGRLEVNLHGIVLGRDQNNSNLQSSNVLISGVSMESNTSSGIYIAAGAAIQICGVGVGVGTDIEAEYGIYINGGNNIVLSGVVISRSNLAFSSGYGIFVNNGAVAKLFCQSVVSADPWSIDSLQSGQFVECNQPAVTYSNLPTAPLLGTIFNMTDGTGVGIGGTVSSGGGSSDYVLVRGSSAWIRLA